ncbi:hypothetical protein KNP414_02709 [Paenibacillus mucilaginosus KNP414]|uniref:Uncharacterized protein n=1 Tax=Paenibacillus mucilaginosus (strain KNP414) TaxID=1036673 RepID=F8F8C3_PAEMK|nr:hypothetical protein KNP414_02709 [Paenibacillus mucilaginosus KNP414]
MVMTDPFFLCIFTDWFFGHFDYIVLYAHIVAQDTYQS